MCGKAEMLIRLERGRLSHVYRSCYIEVVVMQQVVACFAGNLIQKWAGRAGG